MTETAVTIVEVGPRDGLQNEPKAVSTSDKLALIARLAAAGLRRIEATAYVSPRWVPQMADHDAVMRALKAAQAREPASRPLYSALVPNERGAEAALAAGAQELAVFTAASQTFSIRNTNCTIAEGIDRFLPVLALAGRAGVRVRGYVSCALDCPYEGPVAPAVVADVTRRLADIGCFEIAVADTIGRGTPERTARMLEAVLHTVPAGHLAGHFHDTSGQAIANVVVAWEMGIRVFDGAVAGLGGCPYAPGAAGNLATEKLVDYFESKGIRTGIDQAALLATGHWMRSILA